MPPDEDPFKEAGPIPEIFARDPKMRSLLEEYKTSLNRERELGSKIQSMLDQYETFQKRAREWVRTPAFLEIYHGLHHGGFVKLIADLLGRGGHLIKRTEQLKAEYLRLEKDGELRFAAVVIANPLMFKLPSIPWPAGVVAPDRQDANSLTKTLEFAAKLQSIYRGGAPDMPECGRIMADDTFRAMHRRAFPPAETGGLEATLYAVRISEFQLSLNEDGYPFVPLLVMPGSGPFVYLPWPVLKGKPVPRYTRPAAGVPPPLPGSPRS
jgi:hypothetical protein